MIGKDFAIVPIEDIKPDVIYKAIESEMRIEKITVSKNNRIIIGIDKNIIFDINKNFIKGKILSRSGTDEENILNSIIGKLGIERVYVHLYGQENFLSVNNGIKIIKQG